MEFLSVPLGAAGIILGIVLLISLAVTASNRADSDLNSLSYALAYQRFNKIVYMFSLPVLLLATSCYIDHQQPSFHTAYNNCVTAEGPMKGDAHTTYTGSIARQASCVTIAKQVIANWNNK